MLQFFFSKTELSSSSTFWPEKVLCFQQQDFNINAANDRIKIFIVLVGIEPLRQACTHCLLLTMT